MRTRNLSGDKGQPTSKADNLAAIYKRKCGALDVSKFYGIPRPVTGIVSPFLV
jgi:hypothetical protein